MILRVDHTFLLLCMGSPGGKMAGRSTWLGVSAGWELTCTLLTRASFLLQAYKRAAWASSWYGSLRIVNFLHGSWLLRVQTRKLLGLNKVSVENITAGSITFCHIELAKVDNRASPVLKEGVYIVRWGPLESCRSKYIHTSVPASIIFLFVYLSKHMLKWGLYFVR